MLALRLPPDLEKRLDDLAKRTGRTKSFYARQALEDHIDDLEDFYLAEHRLRDNPVFIPFETVIENLGLTRAEIESATDI